MIIGNYDFLPDDIPENVSIFDEEGDLNLKRNPDRVSTFVNVNIAFQKGARHKVLWNDGKWYDCEVKQKLPRKLSKQDFYTNTVFLFEDGSEFDIYQLMGEAQKIWMR